MPSAIQITGALAPGWMLLGVLVAFVFGGWTYRWTRPPVSSTLRLLLAVLRGAAIASVWLLACGFSVSWNRMEVRHPNVAVLIDRSGSMNAGDRGETTEEQLRNSLGQLQQVGREKSLHLIWYGFGERLENINDINKIQPPGEPVTDGEAALLSLGKVPGETPDAVILLTDGAFNRGGSSVAAARSLHVPVFTVGYGDSLPSKDVQIRSVSAPPEGYAGESFQIDATVSVDGYPKRTLTVQLEDENGNLIASRNVAVDGNAEIHTFSFNVVPERPGLQSWTVVVPELEGEKAAANNRRKVAVRIADRKRRVALISGRPDPEAAAWADALENDPDTQPVIVIGGGKADRPVRGKWEEIQPDSLDGAIVLLAGPYASRGIAVLQSLVSAEKPLFIITGAEGYSHPALDVLSSRHGRWVPSAGLDRIELVPKAQHAILTPSGQWFDGGLQPPPVKIPDLEFLEGSVIAEGTRDLSVRRSVLDLTRGGPRTLLIAADGVGQWNLALRPQDPQGVEFAKLTDRILRWLTLKNAGDRVHLSLARNLVTQGETVDATLTVQDESLRPVGGATLSGRLVGSQKEEPILFEETSPGRWSASVRPSTAGRQRVRVDVEFPSGQRETKSVDLLVDAFQLENVDSRMHPERLREIAAATGAVFAPADSLDHVLRALPEAKGVREIHGIWSPFGRVVVLLLVVLVLAAEWLIRTRTGMP